MLPLYMNLIHNEGPIVHFNIAGRSYVLLKDPDDLKVSLQNESHAELVNNWQINKFCKRFFNPDIMYMLVNYTNYS